MIKLSIIIPHYNSPILLGKLLSTIPQSNEIEVIVVDDNSDKLIKEYNFLKSSQKYSNVMFLVNHTKKKGAGTCRNIGLNKAEGEWILFADSDDFFLEGFYEIISKHFNLEYDVVYFSPTSIELDTGNLSDRHIRYERLIDNYIKRQNVESEVLLRYQFFTPWSKLIKRKFIINNKIQFDEIIASNDIMFSTKVGYYLNSFSASRETIYCVTRSAGSLTTNINKNIYYARLYAHIDYCNFVKVNLEKTQTKYLHLNGIGILLKGLKSRLSFKEVISAYIQLKRNRISVLDRRFINLKFTFKKLKTHYKKNKKDKKYLRDN